MKNQETKKGFNVYQMVTDKVIEQMRSSLRDFFSFEHELHELNEL